MAGRPRKTRLDYFPFAVDFFDDEKIVCISVEHGMAGEMAAIKLLCAIYHNGYFIRWTEAMRLKILRQLPGVDGETLDAIIDRLVHWEFFDKELFEKEKVLTSKAIQRRYFEISKRWLGQDQYDYLLIDLEGMRPKKNVAKKEVVEQPKPENAPAPQAVQPAQPAQAEPPTQDEVKNYFQSHPDRPADWSTQAALFFSHYEAADWRNNQGVRIAQWKSKADYWITKSNHSPFSHYETNKTDKLSRRRGIEPTSKSRKEFNGSLNI